MLHKVTDETNFLLHYFFSLQHCTKNEGNFFVQCKVSSLLPSESKEKPVFVLNSD